MFQCARASRLPFLKGVTHSGPGFRNPRRHAMEVCKTCFTGCAGEHTGSKPSSAWHCLVPGAYCNQAGTLLFCFDSLLRPYKRVQQPDKEFSRTRGEMVRWFVGWVGGTCLLCLHYALVFLTLSPSTLLPPLTQLSPYTSRFACLHSDSL